MKLSPLLSGPYSGSLLAVLAAFFAACNGKDSSPFGDANDRPDLSGDSVGGDSVSDDSRGDDSRGDDTGPDDSNEPSDELMDEEGDVLQFPTGEDEISLVDAAGDTNRDQEFFLIAVNPSEDEAGFRLLYTPATTEGPPPPTSRATRPARRNPQARQPVRPPASPPPPLTGADIGIAGDEFLVRDNFTSETSITPVNATLWALGDYVAIWVDNEVPIDWDYDCDGTVDQPARYDAYGFNNCDLQTVADIIDNNIVVNLRAMFGMESDINGDGTISVVITPVLNTVPLTSSDEDDWGQVASYADPASDLTDFDYESNPSSDEQEVIYVFAPDPYAFNNVYFPTTVEEYTSMALAAEVARSFMKLVLYNNKVLMQTDGTVEEAWLVEALGAVGADICGFGAVYYSDAWYYMDAPYLNGLTGYDNDSLFDISSRGAQYLFGRWLVDTYGTGVLAELTTSSDIGVDNIEAVFGEDFEDLVTKWQVALLTTGYTNSAGDPLVDASLWPPYAGASTLSAPTTAPETPAAGIYYGANGHQTGFNVRGINRWMEGGTTSSPSELLSNRVVTLGTDHHTYTPGYEFFGYGAGGYGAQVVRLTGIEYDATTLDLQSDGDGFFGAVIRWADPPFEDVAIDDIYSTLDVNAVPLPELPSDGTPVYAVGDISAPGTVRLLDGEGEEFPDEIIDTDRWLLDLSGRTENELIQVALWLDRRFENTNGDVAPYDPWIAVVREADLPTPTVADTNSGACPGTDEVWSYPNVVPEGLAAQIFLTDVAYSDSNDDFDACGVPTGTLSCAEDWDQDGVADADEPIPASLVEQIWVEQCQDNGGVMPESAFDIAWIDIDEQDEDELPSGSVLYNIGGLSGPTGEEALLVATLLGGSRYIVVVSGGGDSGVYELSLKQLN